MRPMKFMTNNEKYVAEVRDNRDKNNIKWGIFMAEEHGSIIHMRLNKKTNEFGYEPMPSNRTDEYIKEHSFTYDEMMKFMRENDDS